MNLKSERNHNIDALKGIAIIFILITHGSWTETERSFIGFPFAIDMAVPIFMLLSGYVSALTTYDSYNTITVIRKIIRFTVPYLIFCFFEIPILCYLGKITLLEGLYAILTGGRGPGSYFYPIMIQFIFLFPIIYSIIKKLKAVGLLIIAIVNISYEMLAKLYEMGEGCYRLLVFRYLFLIAAGTYIFLYGYNIKKSIVMWTFMTSVLCIILFTIVKIDPMIINRNWVGTSWVIVPYIVPIVYYFISSNIRIKLIEYIGKASYNIYLIQMAYYLMGYSVIYRFLHNTYICNFISIPICIIAGIIFYSIDSNVTAKINTKLISKKNDNADIVIDFLNKTIMLDHNEYEQKNEQIR